MKPDDPVCLCFHVTRRKVVNFIRIEKPRRPSQLSQCFGAGTGCGWCRPYLERLLADETGFVQGTVPGAGSQVQSDRATPSTQAHEGQPNLNEISFDQYTQGRTKYVKDGGGTPPPGATPIDDKDSSNEPPT